MESTETNYKTYKRMRTKLTVSHKDAVPDLSEVDAGNEVAKQEILTVVLPCAPPEPLTSQGSSWFLVPRALWSKKRSRRKKKEAVCDTGFPRGTTEECPVESSVPARKTRKIKRIADESDSEVIIPRRSHFRGQPRKRLSCNKTEIEEPGMLDSKTFECYLENIWREFPEEKKIPFTYLDCLWFSSYSTEHYKEKVLNWIKKKNILSKKYVFVPIVKWSHWSLLILCHFGESRPSERRSRCMLLLDSLQTANPKRLEPEIRRFILDIYTTEERPESKEQLRKIPLLVPKVPQQRNDKECGNFVLYYIKLFIESAPENFSISKGFPYFMKEDWFTCQGLEGFYQRLDSIRKAIDTSDDVKDEDDDHSVSHNQKHSSKVKKMIDVSGRKQ